MTSRPRPARFFPLKGMATTKKTRDFVLLYLNGKPRQITGEAAGLMLSDYLRYELGLTGTKIVCAEGDCGACTVLRRFRGPGQTRPYFEPVNSCITTVAQMDGSHLVTVEALAEGTKLSPVQEAMVSCHGSQCGFCTPGFVMALTGLVEKKLFKRETDSPLESKEAKNSLTGNLCRCTGYQPILDAAAGVVLLECAPLAKRFCSKEEEKALEEACAVTLHLKTRTFSFFAPTSAKEAAKYLAANSKARLLGAGTDLGVLVNKNKLRFSQVVSLHLVPELFEIKKTGKRLRVGGRVTLSELRRATEELIPELARFLDLFASPQIKNVATLAGNVANASPIADTPPFLLAAETKISCLGPRGERKVALDKFYLGYKKIDLKQGEIVASLEFDIPGTEERLSLKKVSQRKDLDISSVNMALRLSWAKDKSVERARVAFGGVAAVPLRLKKTEAALEGKPLGQASIREAVKALQQEITPLSDLRGSEAFRRVLAETLFLRELANEAPA